MGDRLPPRAAFRLLVPEAAFMDWVNERPSDEQKIISPLLLVWTRTVQTEEAFEATRQQIVCANRAALVAGHQREMQAGAVKLRALGVWHEILQNHVEMAQQSYLQ